MSDDKLHEECGVFGIYSLSGKNVSQDIYYGLIALQHRGQEAAGIAVSDTSGPMGNLSIKKDMGLVSEVFHKEDLQKLEGNIGVGHVRYSTTGGSRVENAQPIAMNYIKGSLALVHNGNIVNASELKNEQMYRGLAHYTTSDSEVLAYEIIGERVKAGTIEEAIKNAASKLRGGYAVVVMSPRKLVGIRDPFGIKPLILGRKPASSENTSKEEFDESYTYILASESTAITSVGGEIIRDIEPGEIISITKDGIASDRGLCQVKRAHCIFEYIYFARNDSVMDGIEIHDARVNAGKALARKSRVDADIVVGVPDSGLAAAEGYALESGIPFALAFHKNSYIGRSFIKPTDEERRTAVHMKLSVLGNVVKDKNIVIIDDSIVRGTTMKQLIEMLRKAGAKAVHVRISSPPFLYPCYYGTDVPTAKQLIASHHSSEEVCKSVGADSLEYLSVEDFKTMVGDLPLCTACFTEEYPV
ncbi:MAG: amidophosphoribosyltransferase [Eubacterium sp.]|nr:amidophosphoribosyltransferase [Eubacterium sp.]